MTPNSVLYDHPLKERTKGLGLRGNLDISIINAHEKKLIRIKYIKPIICKIMLRNKLHDWLKR